MTSRTDETGTTKYVIYDKGTDGIEDKYTVRAWRCEGARYWPDGDPFRVASLDAARQLMVEKGLICLQAHASDPENLLETWL